VAFGVYAVTVSVRAVSAFEGRRWDIPAHVYAAPVELYAGAPLTADELESSLSQTGYIAADLVSRAGEYRRDADSVSVHTRSFRHWDALEPSRAYTVAFRDGRVAAVRDSLGAAVPLARLEPVRLGSLFSSHHEDRILVQPDEIPGLLVDALKAIEDRRFDDHLGLDFAAIARAAWVNLRHGEIRQGGSTLTQQLVKSYFLGNERTFRRKFREAIMAVALELRYSKEELLQAYVNEIFLGQQGARAIHGFGLASEFYFSRQLPQLELHEIALLVAIVNGPSYYDPRRHPERALERRDRVLDTLAAEGVIDQDAADDARRQPLGLSNGSRMLSRYQPAFMDLVRRQLADDYPPDELAAGGLRVFTSLDPLEQWRAEQQLASGLAALAPAEPDAGVPPEGAVVVTRYQTGEVIAMVGGRDVEYDGFNRALGAERPIGSLVKPVVYLAAFQGGRYDLSSRISDEPVEVPLQNGDVWAPQNFDRTSHGDVPVLRALSDSYNQATVRLGLDVGVEQVADLLGALGLSHRPTAHPSLLLGAVTATPFEVARVYGSLASGGFNVPLRAVRSVIDAEGKPLGRYPLELAPAADPVAVSQVNAALIQVMAYGTGKTARQLLPPQKVTAGKTGTSNDFRDSWFAGFDGDRLAVVWVGNDDNSPTGLTGATGALPIWASLMNRSGSGTDFVTATPDGLQGRWLDYASGYATFEGCAGAVRVPLPADSRPPRHAGCGGPLRHLAERARELFNGNN